MKKRICSFLLALVAVLGLAACAKRGWQEQYDLGIKYLTDGNYSEAIIAFTAAIEIDQKQPSPYSGRGRAYALSGDTEDNLTAAQADFEQAIALDETFAEAWLGLADVYIRRGDYDKALEVLKDALDKTGNDQSIADKIAEMESGNISDSSGKVRRMSAYDPGGALVWYHEYTYNGEGNMATATSYNGAGTRTGHVNLVQDQNGHEVVSFWYETYEGSIGKMEYEYNGSGKYTRVNHYNLDGALGQYYLYQYDSNGNQTREDNYSPEGELWGYRVFEYDAAGREIKASDYNADGTLWGYYTNEYNSDGRRTAYSRYNENNELEARDISRYDDQGNYLGEDRYDGAGNLIQSTVNQS